MAENVISGPPVSQETLNNTNHSLSRYIINVTKKHLNKVFMVSIVNCSFYNEQFSKFDGYLFLVCMLMTLL